MRAAAFIYEVAAAAVAAVKKIDGLMESMESMESPLVLISFFRFFHHECRIVSNKYAEAPIGIPRASEEKH